MGRDTIDSRNDAPAGSQGAEPGPTTSRRWSARSLLVCLVLACLLPGVIGSGALFVQEYEHEQAELQTAGMLAARSQLQALDGLLKRAELTAQALATTDSLARRDLAEFHRRAVQLLQKTDAGNQVVLIDEGGRQLVNTRRAFGEPLARHGNPDQLHRVLAGGKAAPSDIYLDGTRLTPTVSVDVPILDGGRATQDLAVEISPQRIADLLRAQSLPPGWSAAALDSRGEILAYGSLSPAGFLAPGDLSALAQRLRPAPEGIVEARTADGSPMTYVYSRSPYSGWSVVIGISEEYEEAAAGRGLWLQGLAVASLFGIGLGLAWFMGGRIARSIQALTAPALALGSGKAVPVPATYIREADEVAGAIGTVADLLARQAAAVQQAHDSLRESEARFRQMADSAPVLIWIADTEQFCTWVNKPWLTFTGRSLAQELGKGWTEGVHPKDLGLCERTWALAFERRQPFSIEYRLRRCDGEYRWMLHQGVPRVEAGNVFAGYIGSAMDITERRLAEERLFESELRFRSTFEHAAVGIAQVSLDGRWLRVNDTLCGIVGYDRDELLGLSFLDLIHLPDREDAEARARELLAGNNPSYAMEKRYVRKDGVPTWVNLRCTLARTPSGEPEYCIAVVEDIQRRKEAESALAEARASHEQHLEQQVAERTAALVALNKELQAFTYAASHDLKAPLGRINSFSTLLERSCRERLQGDELLFIDFIRQNAMRLTTLIEDMLAHAQIDKHTANPQAADLREAVQTVLREKAEDIQENRARVRENLPEVEVLVDPLGLCQVLRNLLENALKYSARAQPPVIEIGGELAGDKCRLWVRDNGVGFDMAYHDQIFDIFRRLHTYDEFPGSGIGLSLVKKAMAHMGGRVWAESAPGQGATFFLELQVASHSPAAAPARETTPA